MDATNINRHNGHDDSEKATGVRHSFRDDGIGRKDRLVSHASARVRIIEYPVPSPDGEVVRDRLRNAGVLLGHQLDRAGHADAFRIPVASRPIVYDAHSEAKGAFSYGDDQLYYDLGELLAKAYVATDGGLLTGEIGKEVAFVEFTQPSERRLFLVPGVEASILVNSGVHDPMAYYIGKLEQELNLEFPEASAYFRMGFSEVPES